MKTTVSAHTGDQPAYDRAVGFMVVMPSLRMWHPWETGGRSNDNVGPKLPGNSLLVLPKY